MTENLITPVPIGRAANGVVELDPLVQAQFVLGAKCFRDLPLGGLAGRRLLRNDNGNIAWQ